LSFTRKASHLANRNLLDRLTTITPVQWLIAAAVLHLVLTLTVFLIGHFRILPNNFDEHGIGISFAVDGVGYQSLSSNMVRDLREHGIAAWLDVQAPFHCRLISLAFLFLGSLVGNNILAAEPLNLAYYLGILIFIRLLGREIFDSLTGLVAAVLVAIWPSFLLHSTQLIRDSLSILCMLALLLLLVVLLQRVLSWRKCFSLAVPAIALVIAFWLARGNIWNVVFASLAITVILFMVKIISTRQLFLPSLFLLLVILSSVVVVPTMIESTTVVGAARPVPVIAIHSGPATNSNSVLVRLFNQIRSRRRGFQVYNAQESNIDANVSFNNATDIVKYLPRATVVGAFAPFPTMWFVSGTGGRVGRLLAGFETLVMYLLYVPMLVCVWTERRRLAVWLLFLTSFVGMVALGLVVVNAGALYRVRYVFWILLILLAVRQIRSQISHRKPINFQVANGILSPQIVEPPNLNLTSDTELNASIAGTGSGSTFQPEN
jgi:hypothetical protein